MATPPLPPLQGPAPSSGGTNKILLGCGIGCGVLLILLLVAGGFFYVKVVKPIATQTTAIEAVRKENEATVAELRALDEATPSSIGANLDTAQLAASDIDAYLGMRLALADEAEAAAAASRRITDSLDLRRVASGGNPLAALGMMTDLFAAAAEHQRARGQLMRAAADELAAQATGPSELVRLIELIEWRFLRREEALVSGLTASERQEWMSNRFSAQFARSLLDATGGKASASDRAQFERQLETAEERLDELKATAEERAVLTPATRALLESRRRELQALPAEGLGELASLTDDSNPMEWLAGLQDGFSP